MVFNERDEANELLKLPIDNNMNGILEENELEEEGDPGSSDEDE